MYEIKNLQFQPLTLHKANGATLHLGPRGTTCINDDEHSPEIHRAVTAMLIRLTHKTPPKETKPKAKAKTTCRRSSK